MISNNQADKIFLEKNMAKKTIKNSFEKVKELTFRMGFTLAEVLITLGIIGVVAALTLPNLLNKIQKENFQKQFKKEFAELSIATEKILADNNASDIQDLLSNLPTVPTNGSTLLSNKLVYQYVLNMKTLQVCYYTGGYMTPDTCWPADNVMHYLGNNSTVTGYSPTMTNAVNGTGFITSSGAHIWFNVTADGTCSSKTGGSCPGLCQEGGMDVNGDKGPNRFGYDIYSFVITKYKLRPGGYSGCGVGYYNSPMADDCAQTSANQGKSCAVKVITNQTY